MKQIIDGKVFNTETSIKIAAWDNGLSNRDFSSLSESLYKTKKGAFFLYAEGGASTYCAVKLGNSRTGGVKFVSFSKQDAIEWAEQRSIDPDKIASEIDLEEA